MNTKKIDKFGVEIENAEHPFRQSAIHIIEEVIEPLGLDLEGEEYYNTEDAIVELLAKFIELKVNN